jgi:hypothetical protein
MPVVGPAPLIQGRGETFRRFEAMPPSNASSPRTQRSEPAALGALIRAVDKLPPLAWALTPLACLAVVAAWVRLDSLVARLTNDDPSYYILVAHNLFVHGPTYDGLYLTNGVHPLFALVLGVLYQLGGVRFENLSAVSVLACVCFGCAFSYVLLEARPLRLSTRIGITSLMSSLAIYPILYRGMEGALALLMVALFLRAVAQRRVGFWIACALCIGLWAARLELLALPPIAIVLGGRALSFDRRDVARWFAPWLTSVLVLVTFFAVSYYWTGLALPVSGVIKQSSTALLPYFISIGVSCGFVAVLGLLLPSLSGLARRAWMTHSLLAWAAVFFLAHAWGQPDAERQTWYYFVCPALLAFAMMELELRDQAGRWVAGCLSASAMLALLWEGSFVIPLRADSWRATQAIVNRAKEVAVPGERFMGPGWMALLVGPEFEPFSQDGLVGGVEQYRALREGRLLEFAYESDVRFLVTSNTTPATAPPSLPPPWQLSLVSNGAVPSGRSLWALASRDDQTCGVGSCRAFVSVFRLSRSTTGQAPASTLTSDPH